MKDVSLVHRLVRALRGPGTAAEVAHARARVVATRERLDQAREDRLEVQQRLAEAREQIELLRAKLRASEQAADRWKREATNHRRRVLSPFVVRDILPLRRQQVPLRASARDATLRDQRMLDIAPAYAQAIAAGVDSSHARRIELEGLSWWVPLRATDPETVKRVVNKEDLPYRAFTQTREFSIGGVMLDLGAHDGSTSIPRVVLGDVEAVYCAEPDPLNYQCLVANIVDNGLRGFVLPDRIAVGAVDRTGHLFRTKASRGHRVVADRRDEDGELVSIRVRTLDGWVDDLRVDPRIVSFVKSDTQGYELQVLLGASRLLAHRQIAWQLEFCPALMRLAGSEPQDFIALVQRHFTHFVDLNADAPGKRRQPVAAMAERLDYVAGLERAQTDVIVYCAAAGARR